MASPPPQSSPQSSPQQSDSDLIVAIAGLLIVGAGLAVTAGGIAKLAGLPTKAVTGALEACGGHPLPMSRPSSAQTAYAATKAANRMFRAAFVLNAARRISTGLKAGGDLKTLVGKEKHAWGLHRAATARRLLVAKNVDAAAQSYGQRTAQGTLLGWYATVDGRTDATCIAADQTNFYSERIPMIGLPGSVHMHCRCRPGPPHIGAKMTYQANAVRRGPDSTRFYNGGLK